MTTHAHSPRGNKNNFMPAREGVAIKCGELALDPDMRGCRLWSLARETVCLATFITALAAI
jgi:hypothetical protein